MASARGDLSRRVPETDEGLQGDALAGRYDAMQRHIRDRGWIQDRIDEIRNAGIDSGDVLEIGCGPGYLGLEWMSQANGRASLVGVDISAAMVRQARANALEYGVAERCRYECADVQTLPFADHRFGHTFSSSSLHEWGDPLRAFSEIHRVLRPGARYFIVDLRRDIDRTTFQFMAVNIAADMRPGFRSSVRSSYLKVEIEAVLKGTELATAVVTEFQMGLTIAGRKDDS